MEKTVKQLWDDYLFLTKEMAKMLTLKDIDLFNEIVSQRQKLQELITAAPDKSFVRSAAGQELLNRIKFENNSIAIRLRGLMAQTRQNHQISNAYDGGFVNSLAGLKINKNL